MVGLLPPQRADYCGSHSVRLDDCHGISNRADLEMVREADNTGGRARGAYKISSSLGDLTNCSQVW